MLPFSRLDDLRRARPLIHCISNLVSANDCANVLLAVGASPMMAQAEEEMAEIAALSGATVFNTGTPSREKFAACRLSAAAGGDRPTVLDPVGVGASAWRLRETEALLEGFTPTILRVNWGEAQALLHRGGGQGVDSTDQVPMSRRADCAAALARERKTAVLLSGEEDMISDGVRVFRAAGGSRWMSRVTGTGCMLSALCGAFAAVEPDGYLAAALASVFWKACAMEAEQALASGQGAGSFRVALLDAASRMDGGALARE